MNPSQTFFFSLTGGNGVWGVGYGDWSIGNGVWGMQYGEWSMGMRLATTDLGLLSSQTCSGGCFLVVSPTSVLYNWISELETWSHLKYG